MIGGLVYLAILGLICRWLAADYPECDYGFHSVDYWG
jgi:hypothetical protein